MANADFNREQTVTGGFDAGNYRAAPAQQMPQAKLTPLQKKLAAFESHLPAALAKQSIAAVLCLAVVLASFAGFGGSKLKSKYNAAARWYTQGVAADNGYNLNEELTTRANTAANVITTGTNALGADSTEVQAAQTALDTFTQCMERAQQDGGMHALYNANEALGSAIDQLYAKLQEKSDTPMRMGAVQGQYGQFSSSGTIIGNLKYNDAVYDYLKDVGDLPAKVLGALVGVKEVEPFA